MRSELSFTHPLYRAAIYDDLSPAVRRGLQARAAAVVVGGERMAHRVAAAVGPDEQLAGELESAAVADADLGDLAAAAWAFERSAYLSPDAEQRERRLLDAAGAQLIAADNAGAAGRWRPAAPAAPAVTRCRGCWASTPGRSTPGTAC